VIATDVVLAGATTVWTVPHSPSGDHVDVETVGGAVVVVVVGAVVVVVEPPAAVVVVDVGAVVVVVVVVVAAAWMVVLVRVVSGVLALHDTLNEPAAVSV